MVAYPEYFELGPFDRAAGTLRLPGSKSISNRVLLLAALARGSTAVHDLLSADDVDRMLEALRTLGVKVDEGKHAGDVNVTGCGGAFPANIRGTERLAPRLHTIRVRGRLTRPP